MLHIKQSITILFTIIVCSLQTNSIETKVYQNEGKNFEISIPDTWDVKVTQKEVYTKQGGWEDFFNKLEVTATYYEDWGTFRRPVEEELKIGSEDSAFKYQNNLKITETDTYIIYSYDLKSPVTSSGNDTVTYRKYEFEFKQKPRDHFTLIAESYKEFTDEETRIVDTILASVKFL
ncbi:MAG: hypothetical protein AAF617_14850, partial [Bacteroidota bacterium]